MMENEIFMIEKPALPKEFENLSVEEFCDKAAELNRQIAEININKLTVNHINLLAEYSAVKQFISNADKAEDFLAESVQEISDGKKVSLVSLMPPDEYSKMMGLLTNKFDDRWINLCKTERLIQKGEYERLPFDISQRDNKLKSHNIDELAVTDVMSNKKITMLMIIQVIEQIRIEQEKALELEKEYIEQQEQEREYEEQQEQEQEKSNEGEIDTSERAVKTMAALAAVGELYVISEMSVRDLQIKAHEIPSLEKVAQEARVGTAEKPVVLVSNDGYAIIAQANEGKEGEREVLDLAYAENVADGRDYTAKEAIINPKETTIDTSKVGGNIRLVENDDQGSIEKHKGHKSRDKEDGRDF